MSESIASPPTPVGNHFDAERAAQSAAHDGVRRLVPSDVPALLTLARDEIPDTMAARLGPKFAERYHQALLEEPWLRLDGFFMNGELVGYIVYSHDVREALRRAFARHRLTFAAALAYALLSPRRLAYVVRIAATIFGKATELGTDIKAELITIAVRRAVRGRGAVRSERGPNVPHALISSAFEHLRSLGIAQVKVFCKPESVEPIANGFVRKEGFALQGRGTRYGIPANLYVKQLGTPDGTAS